MPREDDPAQQPVKLYFRIGEVASIVGVEPHVLRYWESEFRTIRPQKSRSGQRVYSRRDVDRLLRVKELLYDEGFTIAGARKKLRDNSRPAAEQEEQLAAAARIRDKLLEVRKDVLLMLDELGGEEVDLDEADFDEQSHRK